MVEGQNEDRKLNVFISYSRDDLVFADQLDAALGITGFATTLDRHGIHGGEDWKHRLGNLIRAADTVVFVLSPSSAVSEICAWEVAESVHLGKRIVPVLCRPFVGASPPPQLADLNYIYFYAEPKSPGSGFGAGLVRLVTALNSDLDWLREHTRYLQRASEWVAGNRPNNRLLSGPDIELARGWAASRPKDAPAPTALHLDFIKASETEESLRNNAEVKRLQQIAEAHTAREAALAEKEAAQKSEAAAAKRVVRRTLAGLGAALVLAAAAAVLGLLAWSKQNEATFQAQEALAQKTEAEAHAQRAEKSAAEADAARHDAIQTRDEALLTQSKYLADAAKQAIEIHNDPGSALLLALEALPDQASRDEITRNRPYWAPAEVSLERARRLLRERTVFKGHTDWVVSVAVTSDGSRVVTGSKDNTIRVWDGLTGAESVRIKGPATTIKSIAITPDRARVVTSYDTNTVTVWDINTGAELLQLKGHAETVVSVAVTPDGSRFVTGSSDKTARIWNAETGVELAQLKGHSDTVKCVAVAPDGNRYVTCSNTTARIWDAGTGAEIFQLTGHADTVNQAAITPDGSRIITGSDDHSARVWDARTGIELFQLKGHSDRVTSVAAMPGGEHIVSGSDDGTARLWNIKTGVQMANLQGHTGSARKWQLTKELKELKSPAIASVAVTSDGSLVTGSADHTARLWDAKIEADVVQLKGHTDLIGSLAWMPDGSRFVTGSKDGTARMWDAKSGAELLRLNHAISVDSVAVTPDGSRVVTTASDNTARIWDASTGAEIAILEAFVGPIRDMAVAPDGMRIVTLSNDKVAKVWDLQSGKEIGQINNVNHIHELSITPDGSRAVFGWTERIARIWNLEAGTETAQLRGHTGIILSIAVTPDGSRVVTGSMDHTVRIWDAKTGAELARFEDDSPVWSVKVTPDGSRVVSGSNQYLTKNWVTRILDINRGVELAQLPEFKLRATSWAITPDGTRIVAAFKEDNTLRIWQLFPAGQTLVEQARNVVPRCLTAEQRRRYHLTPTPPPWCEILQKWPYDPDTVVEDSLSVGAGREAVTALLKAIAVNPSANDRVAPKLAAILNSLAWDAYENVSMRNAPKDQLRFALADADMALRYASGDAGILDTRGQIYLALDYIDEALADFDKAILSGLNYAGAFCGRARARELKGNKDAAIADYLKSLELKAADEYSLFAQANAVQRLKELGVLVPTATAPY